MAANEYYNSGQRPLPAHPPNHSTQSLSPVTSPFDDHNAFNPSTAHLVHTQTGTSSHYADTAYHSPAPGPPPHGGYQHNNNSQASDPFADQNAIPLRNQYGKMGEGHHQAGAHSYMADPEGRPPGMDKGKKKKGMKGYVSGRVTWVVFFLTTVQVAVFIGELIKNGMLTGSPIQTKPNFNIMIGPSPYVLINMGARYQPCMHYMESIVNKTYVEKKPIMWPCPSMTAIPTSNITTYPNGTTYQSYSEKMCNLNELCGLGGVPVKTYDFPFSERAAHKADEPNQWYRFITPIFLHAGLIHIGFNMLLQWTLGRDMEKEIGSLRFAVVYFSAGIFGFVLGGNYAAEGITSVGASGSLFGILALVLLDLLYNWSTRPSPMKDLLFLLLDVAISFVLGLLPGLDNFSHIGGFCMGIVLGVCLLHSPQALRRRIGVSDPPYATVANPAVTTPAGPSHPSVAVSQFAKQPLEFFKGRQPFWWAWWGLRAVMLVVTLIGFILLLRNFYDWRNGCVWCKHLTCLPITTNGVSWCDMGALQLGS